MPNIRFTRALLNEQHAAAAAARLLLSRQNPQLRVLRITTPTIMVAYAALFATTPSVPVR